MLCCSANPCGSRHALAVRHAWSGRPKDARHANAAAYTSHESIHRCNGDVRTVRARSFSDGGLSRNFSQFVNESDIRRPLEHRSPTRLIPPTSVVAAQMDALQINDWPETDAGIQTAFRFTMPDDAGSAMAVHKRARAWSAKEAWLDLEAFREQLHAPPYSALLNCTSWKPVSGLQFPSQRNPNRAVQAVEVTHSPSTTARSTSTDATLPQSTAAASKATRFTFCLEMVEAGTFKECWLTVGVRVGDYSL